MTILHYELAKESRLVMLETLDEDSQSIAATFPAGHIFRLECVGEDHSIIMSEETLRGDKSYAHLGKSVAKTLFPKLFEHIKNELLDKERAKDTLIRDEDLTESGEGYDSSFS